MTAGKKLAPHVASSTAAAATPAPAPIAPAYALCDVEFVYGVGSVPVLSGACAEFEAGRAHVILGPSGAGKTTVLRLLMGLESPSAGKVARPAGARIAAVFQEDRLCDGMTATANIRLPHAGLHGSELREYVAREREALSAAGIPADACARPVRELSGGQRRRVAILRALLADADAVFLDEPLRGLDAQSAARVADLTRPLLAQKTVFWVTHDPRDADRLPNPVLWAVRDGQVMSVSR